MNDWLIKVGPELRGPGADRRAWVRAAAYAPVRARVVAIPHAGGWPAAFRSWREVLPAEVELLVGQLPGRGTRTGEPSLRRVEPLVDGLAGAVAELDPVPYAIVGHSFGSVLGYELTKAMERKGLPPRQLVVSARQAPCFPSQRPFAHQRSDAELVAHLLDIGGVSPELVRRQELVRAALPAIRADLEAMETYQRPTSGTSVPILALGAVDDPVVVADRLYLWSLETSGTFSRQMHRGGHFYLYARDTAAKIAPRLSASLISQAERLPDPAVLRS